MFLLLGRSQGCLRNFRLHYSTSADAAAAPLPPIHFMVDYLINSLGFSREEAISTSTKVTHCKSTKHPDSVLIFLKQYGFDKTHIRNIISVAPKLLLSDPTKTLEPKFRVLQDLGLSGSDLVKVIRGNPDFIRRGLDVQPCISYLKELLGSDENLVKALRRSYWLLSCYTKKRIESNVLLLQKFSFSKEKIQRFIVYHPRYVLLSPKWLEGLLLRVERELGIPRDSAMFIHGVQALASVTKSTIKTKFDILRSFGWSESDIMTMVRNQPFSLSISEAKLRNGLNFFMNVLGYNPSYLASHPKLLAVRLEQTVVPRHEILKILQEKKLLKRNVTLYSVVCYSELKFIEKFVVRYKDAIPDICEIYANYVKQRRDFLF